MSAITLRLFVLSLQKTAIDKSTHILKTVLFPVWLFGTGCCKNIFHRKSTDADPQMEAAQMIALFQIKFLRLR